MTAAKCVYILVATKKHTQNALEECGLQFYLNRIKQETLVYVMQQLHRPKKRCEIAHKPYSKNPA